MPFTPSYIWIYISVEVKWEIFLRNTTFLYTAWVLTQISRIEIFLSVIIHYDRSIYSWRRSVEQGKTEEILITIWGIFTFKPIQKPRPKVAFFFFRGKWSSHNISTHTCKGLHWPLCYLALDKWLTIVPWYGGTMPVQVNTFFDE